MSKVVVEEGNHRDTEAQRREEKIEEFGHRATEKMRGGEERGLPGGWVIRHLETICEVNPKNCITDDIDVGFVSMSEAAESILEPHTFTIKKWYSVKKGYTHFINEDVLLAKITPCFENGKKAIVKNLPNGVGAGSTEFFVLRPRDGVVISKWIYYFISRWEIRVDGKKQMSGAVGQQRIPKEWLVKLEIPLPPLDEQERIVARLDTLLGELKAARGHLEALPDIIKRFRKSVLAQAVSGKLTEEWREEHAAELPSAEELLASVRAERRKAWEEAELAKLCAKGKEPKEDGWKKKYVEPEAVDSSELKDVPEGWRWDLVNNIAHVTKLAGFEYTNYICNNIGSGEIKIIKAQNIKMGRFIRNDFSCIPVAISEILHRSKLYGIEVLMTFIGAGTGEVCLSPKDGHWHLAPNVAKITPGATVLREYLEIAFMSPIVQDIIHSFIKASAQPSLSMETIRLFSIPLPSLLEQAEIVRRVDELFAYADALEKRVADARVMADRLEPAILAKAFRGELSEQVPQEAAAWALTLAKLEADAEQMVKAGGKKARKVEAMEAAEPAGEYVATRRGRPRKVR